MILHTGEILIRSRVLLISVLSELAAKVGCGWAAARGTQDCVLVIFACYAL